MSKRNTAFIHLCAIARRHPSAFLLAAQLVSLVLYVLFEGIPSGRFLLAFFGMLVLLLVVWVVIRSPAISCIGWIIAILVVFMSILSWLFANPNILIWATLLEAVLYLYGACGLIVYMMGDDSVTTDDLFAIGATFTLIAWGFAYLIWSVRRGVREHSQSGHTVKNR